MSYSSTNSIFSIPISAGRNQMSKILFSFHNHTFPQTNIAKLIFITTSNATATFQRSPIPRNLHLVPHCTFPSGSSPNGLKEEEKAKTEQEEEEARQAVMEYLQEFGASMEDSRQIVLNCGKYVKMLIENLHDMDDWNSWSGGNAREVDGSERHVFSFKDKVYEMAKGKGDMGILPFLESIGLSLSSATHLARYVSSSSGSSQVLPALICKVKYVKEILFSNSEDQALVGKNARRMMMHLSISADDDMQHTLSFFEKIEARRGGLDQLGYEHCSFRYLIESFPRLLLLPIEYHMKPLMKFFRDIGVPEGSERSILLLFPPVIFYDIGRDIKPRLKAFEKVGAHDNDMGKMLLKYPWILSPSILENFEKVLDVFEEEKVTQVCASAAIRTLPQLLGCSVDRIKLMVDQFREMGIGNKKLGHVIVTSPQLLVRRPQEFFQVVSFLKDLGLDQEAIVKILGRCPEIFASSIDKTLKKKLEFLSDIGISKSHFPRVIRKYPELFVCDVDRALRPRMKFLMKIGLSRRDIGFMVRRFSPLLGYNTKEVLMPKLEFLMHTMEKPLSEVVDYPRYFSYSLEKRIKPRYLMLKDRNIDCSLKDMLAKNDEEFAADYMDTRQMAIPPS